MGSTQQRRTARGELHLRLVPEFKRVVADGLLTTPGNRTDAEVVEDLRRYGALAGYRAERLVDAAFIQWLMVRNRAEGASVQKIWDAVLDLDGWLGDVASSPRARILAWWRWRRFFRRHPEIPRKRLYGHAGSPITPEEAQVPTFAEVKVETEPATRRRHWYRSGP